MNKNYLNTVVVILVVLAVAGVALLNAGSTACDTANKCGKSALRSCPMTAPAKVCDKAAATTGCCQKAQEQKCEKAGTKECPKAADKSCPKAGTKECPKADGKNCPQTCPKTCPKTEAKACPKTCPKTGQ